MTVRYWMLLNIAKCNSVTELVTNATKRFNYLDTPRWLWNEAQYLWDLDQERRIAEKYVK